LTTNISGIGLEIDSLKQTSSTAISSKLNKNHSVNFCSLTAKLRWPMCTYPKSTVCAILDNFRFWLRLSTKWIKISTTGNKLDRLPSLPHWGKNLMNFGQLAA